MALEVAEDVVTERMGDLGVDPGVLNVFVAEVVGDVLDAAAGVEEMHGDRVSQRVDRAALDAGGAGVVAEEVLDPPFLERQSGFSPPKPFLRRRILIRWFLRSTSSSVSIVASSTRRP
jgi:hypothetical protein